MTQNEICPFFITKRIRSFFITKRFCLFPIDKPIIKSFTSKPDPPINGFSVTLKCESDGVPEPDYMIKFENGSVASATTTYEIPLMESSYEGIYTCIAKNIKGNDSIALNLTGQSKIEVATHVFAYFVTAEK